MSEFAPSVIGFTPVFPRHLPVMAVRASALHRQLKHFERQEAAWQKTVLAAQLKHLVAHAAHYSPYWAEKLSGFVLEKPSSLDEILQDIPPLSRRDLQERYQDLIARFPGREKMKIAIQSSSGSTGKPVQVQVIYNVHTPLHYASLMLDARWHKPDPKKRFAHLTAKVEDNDRVPVGAPFNWFGSVSFGFSFRTKDRDDSEIYDHCAKRKPAYLNCGPTTVVRLARYALQSGRDDLRPEMAFTFGSAVTEETRELARRGLGTKIIDCYSCEETGYIAAQCPVHEHFHVLSPTNLVEIVDDNNRPCPVGMPGRVLITGMHSYGMPLLRYEIGDVAEWGEPCDCGITLPVIKKLWGRTQHIVVNPDGGKTFARIYARDFEDVPGLKEYRFVLHADRVVVAQIVASSVLPEIAAMVTERVQRALNYPYPVIVRQVDAIDWGKSWKQETFAVSDAPSSPS